MLELDLVNVGALIFSAVAACFAGLEHLRARRADRRALAAEKQAKAAEDSLALAKNRVDGPWFKVVSRSVSLLRTLDQGDRHLVGGTPGRPRRLALAGKHTEVEAGLAKGTPVLMLMENVGADHVTTGLIELDGEQVEILRERDEPGSKPLWWIEYPYDPAQHGKEQRLVLEFHGLTGFHRRHTYVLRHGVRDIRRIDPPDGDPGSDGGLGVTT